ncbi:CYTH domain-containing protein [soil metagenome]
MTSVGGSSTSPPAGADEIERKFLLDELPSAVADVDPTWIDQGYLSVTDDVEVRIRARAGDHLLTVKHGRGEVRTEVTIELTAAQFDDLWPSTDGQRIRKQRWVIPHDTNAELEVEVDQFHDALNGLLIAEVEFASPHASAAFEPPAWFGREVTDDDRYRNAALADGPPDD